MSHAISDEALDTIFRGARTQNKWSDKAVSNAMLMAIWDLMRWGPTAANTNPARIVFVTSADALVLLLLFLFVGFCVLFVVVLVFVFIGYDLDFPDHMPKLFPNQPKMKDNLAGKTEILEPMAFRNSSLQGGYFIVAARALGLDCGPMSGFDNAGVDAAFFAGTKIKSNFICAIGHGDPAGVYPRNPRLSFDEACKII